MSSVAPKDLSKLLGTPKKKLIVVSLNGFWAGIIKGKNLNESLKPSGWSWEQRHEHLFKALDDFSAHIICLQEVHVSFLPYVREWAQKNGYFIPKIDRDYNKKDEDVDDAEFYQFRRDCYLMTLVRDDSDIEIISSTSVRFTHEVEKMSPKLREIWEAYGHPGELYNSAHHLRFKFMGTEYNLLNVHLPLDIKTARSGAKAYERVAATALYVRYMEMFDDIIIIGDFNMAPDFADLEKQKAAVRGNMELREPIVLDSDGKEAEVQSTFYGSPNEQERLQGFNSPGLLDRAIVGKYFKSVEFFCSQKFCPSGVPISDHFPIVLVLQK